MSDSLWSHGLYSPWNSLHQNTGVGSLSLLQGIFPIQGSNTVIKSRSPALQADSSPAEPQGKPKTTGVGSLSLCQRMFMTQESNCGFLHCRRILYQLSYQGSPWTPYKRKPVFFKNLVGAPWSRKWQSILLFLPGNFHGQRSLVGCSSWGRKESDMTECARTHTHTHTRILVPWNQTCTHYIKAQSLNHWTTRGVHIFFSVLHSSPTQLHCVSA